MNLFGFHIDISRAQIAPPQTKSFPVTPDEWLRGEDLPTGRALANAYEQVVWVYRAINVLADQVANIPFLFSRGERGRENLLTAGPLPEFYARPHPLLNRFQYWELRVMWLMLRGECFRVPIFEDGRMLAGRGRGAKLRSILLLDPDRFQQIIEDHQLVGWRYTGAGARAPMASQVLLPEEVWFERLPNPFDFWRGLAPLRVAALAAQTDFAAGAFMQGMLENNADAGVIVRSEQQLGDDQQQSILKALRERKRRAGTADRPVFLSGVTEIIKPQLSSSDLQFLENRKFSRGEICAAFGVPEEIVGGTDRAKYDVMAGARLNFIENRVAPLCSRLEAEEDVTVKTIDPEAAGWFDLDSLPSMQEARRNRLAAARTSFEMGVPFNELNRVLDLGFRPLPWGERGYVARNLVAVSPEPRGELAAPSGRSSLPADEPAQRTIARRLSRFLFEQRERALAGLAAGTFTPAQPLLDPDVEQRHLAAAFEPFQGEHPGCLAALEQRAQQAIAALGSDLREGLAGNEPKTLLAARVRAFYNALKDTWRPGSLH